MLKPFPSHAPTHADACPKCFASLAVAHLVGDVAGSFACGLAVLVVGHRIGPFDLLVFDHDPRGLTHRKNAADKPERSAPSSETRRVRAAETVLQALRAGDAA